MANVHRSNLFHEYAGPWNKRFGTPVHNISTCSVPWTLEFILDFGALLCQELELERSSLPEPTAALRAPLTWTKMEEQQHVFNDLREVESFIEQNEAATMTKFVVYGTHASFFDNSK